MPTIASAVIVGIGVLLAGNLLWAPVLAPLNLRFLPGVPWAIVPMAIYLYFYWAFISGVIGPRDTAATRRESLRARRLPSSVWAAAIVTGLIGFGAVLALTAVMARLIVMPVSQIVTPPSMPAATAVAMLMMASVVAGVTEEAAFRGYMQTPIERQYGLAVGDPGERRDVRPAALSDAPRSGCGDAAEWQRSEAAQALVWDTGLDASFLSAFGLCAAFAIATFVLCRHLHRLAVSAHARAAVHIIPFTHA